MEGCHRNFSSDVVHLELENFALPSKSTSPDPRLKIVGSLGKKMVHACMSPPKPWPLIGTRLHFEVGFCFLPTFH